MKSLMIEAVANGFIVRPFTPSCSWAVEDAPHIYVYNTQEDLIKDMPKLLVLLTPVYRDLCPMEKVCPDTATS